MRKVLKITLILIVMFINMAQISNVYAREPKGIDASGTSGQIERKTDEDDEQTSTWSTQTANWWKPKDVKVGETDINKKAGTILGALRVIGIVVSVVALMIIGIRQMTASAEEKSIIKEAMPGYVIGLVMIVAVTVLPSIIYEFTKKL